MFLGNSNSRIIASEIPQSSCRPAGSNVVLSQKLGIVGIARMKACGF
jgi:hypothetical protein